MAATAGMRSRAHRFGGRPAAPPTTPGRLRRTVVALVLCTAALWGTLQTALSGAHTTVSAAEAHADPALVDTAQLSYLLADADRVAAGSFASGTVRLSGPGQRYQDDLKSAHQALARAAEHDATGPAGSGRLQAVEGLLVEYTGLIEQAHATESQGALGTAYLSYATNLMHKPGDGVLAQVRQLRAAEQQELDRQRQSGWLAPAALLGVLAPALLALVLLVATQRFLSRHFNRRLNPCLLTASLLLLALAGWTAAATLHADRAFATAADEALPRLTAAWQARALAADAAGGDALAVVQAVPGQDLSDDFATYTGQLADRPVTPGEAAAAESEPPAFHGILADLIDADLRPDSSPAKRDAAVHTLQDFRQFTAADAELRRQAATRGPAAAAADPAVVATAVGPGPAQLGGAGAAFDADLARLAEPDRQRLADAESAARSDLGLGRALPVLCAAIALLCLGGLWPRIDEYRAAR
ncbi:hypothetical protein ACFV4G_35905 [Kitasatospora sp. NPDC059747]|uniref:hypothetical protein n=1 Tax=Kitasatospora sp. NPDC059747 TaxID=3346930 RepID=UPI003647136B